MVIEKSGLDGEKKVNEMTKEERRKLGTVIKNLPFTIDGLRGWDAMRALYQYTG